MLTKYTAVVIICLRKTLFCCGLLLCFFDANSQEFTFSGKRQKQSLKFKSIKNLIVIPVMINGKGPYDFVLDTGVGPMIITDPSIIDSLNFSLLRKIKVAGLGIETVEAFVSQNISAQIGQAKISYIPTAVLKEDLFNLSGHLGTKIYGLIGYSFFHSFIVDIRYSEEKLFFSSPFAKIKYRGQKIPIEIENQRPYLNAIISLSGEDSHKARFLMDSGASHALSMEMLAGEAFPLPAQKIPAHLGMSLSGQIKGYLGRIKNIKIDRFEFKNIVAGFPDFETISDKVDLIGRNGNIGGELLKKFDIQFNYQEGFMYVKPNSNYKIPFEHDMTGMTIYLDPIDYRHVIIGEIDEGSPAEKSGLCPDDEIIGVNFKPIGTYSFSDLSELFKAGASRTIVFEVYRDNKVFFKIVKLEKRI